jgi:hypothetical protein
VNGKQVLNIFGSITMSRRLTALVIGNGTYVNAEILRNPVNDADDVAGQFQASGFSVIKKTDCSYKEMEQALKGFKSSLDTSDVGLFFFAGHGFQIEGENYLAAIDTDTAGEIEAKHSSLKLNLVMNVMESSQASTSIIILDACRDNPFDRTWSRSLGSRGLAPIYAPRGTLIAYATSPGQFASDGRARNGAYTEALLQHIATPDCSIENMFKRVRNTLSAATGGKQISWEHTSLAGEFFFNLSLGVRIDDYSETALSDSLFVLDDGKASHRLIRALKSLTWPIQNPAMEGYTATIANRASIDSLFVVGRNIYQAACGASHGASAYLNKFLDRTNGMELNKRKAVLDGMLFEVFFNSKAKLRKDFKMGEFQRLFSLQHHKELASSFDFIAECLVPESRVFYSLPGKNHPVVVDVVSKPGDTPNSHIIESLHYCSENILWFNDPDYTPAVGKPPMRERLSLSKFEERVAMQMVVPDHLLTINYHSFNKTGGELIHFPYGWTIRKR